MWDRSPPPAPNKVTKEKNIMSKFKVGDKVKCIRGSEYMNLKENHEYEVIAIS